MEVPIYLAIDTTENWNRSDTALGKSELAIEIHTLPDGTKVKYLLLGDGKPVGPNVERLRAKIEFIAALSGALQELEAADGQLQAILSQTEQKLLANIAQTERRLQQNIDSREVYHNDTLKGKGLPHDPLSVKINYDITAGGLNARAEFTADGMEKTYALPAGFVYMGILLAWINGLGQRAGSDYTLDLDAREITFCETPEKDSVITLAYTAKE